jgi:hypothetical protein
MKAHKGNTNLIARLNSRTLDLFLIDILVIRVGFKQGEGTLRPRGVKANFGFIAQLS